MRMWALTAKVWKAINDTPPAFPVKKRVSSSTKPTCNLVDRTRRRKQ